MLFVSIEPGYGPNGPKISRSDLVSRFGQPASTESKEVSRDPRDPTDTELWILTTWEYPGLRITTLGEKVSPGRFWVDEGEISGTKAPLPYGVRVGQSIDRWRRQFGQPNCIDGRPTYESHFPHGEELWFFGPPYYQVVLFVDGAGKVQRIRWDHPPQH